MSQFKKLNNKNHKKQTKIATKFGRFWENYHHDNSFMHSF